MTAPEPAPPQSPAQVPPPVEPARPRHHLRAEAGQCLDCPSPALPTHRRCQRCLVKHAARSKACRQRMKLKVMAAYGGAFCACCGETHPVMLSIDHIAQDGGRLRKAGSQENGHGLYFRLKREGFPPGYRVLCRNCNFAVYHASDRRCPHRTGCFADPAIN